jgi:predicted nucleic acid-binding protein
VWRATAPKAQTDTSLFIARESTRTLDVHALPDQLAVSVVTIGLLRAGVLAAADIESRDRRLATLTSAMTLDPIPIDETVAHAWARLRVQLRDAGRRMPVNDSWIAATAIALGLPVVSRDDDFASIPGITVIDV